MEHVATEEQVKGAVEQREVAAGTFVLGLHCAIAATQFLQVSTDALGTGSGLFHFSLQLLDVVIVGLK
jgi:hypothetical protein